MDNINQINLNSALELFNLGEVIKSLEILTKLEENNETSLKEQCSISILKSKIFNIIGEYNKELQSLELAHHLSQKIDDVSIIFDVLLQKAKKSIEKGENDSFFDFLGQIEGLIEKNLDELRLKLGDFYFIKGYYFFTNEGNLTQALKNFKESEKIYTINNDKHKLAEIFIELARIMFRKGELDKSMEYFKKS